MSETRKLPGCYCQPGIFPCRVCFDYTGDESPTPAGPSMKK